ncbi:glyoxalase superfamily protein [Millisia brevis]|uniref:glyoxalase superfamily protein n=1 Tax=Millisia brevis TaxID=264148 RepID=UPI000836F442|nr:glyoxalase superfamily protein [Millisia brevis]
MIPLTVDDAEQAARALRASLSSAGLANPTHEQALETLPHTAGYRDWDTYSATLTTPRPLLAVPILRSYDESVARHFYCDYLGFEVQFEHRFAPDLPLYLRVARGDIEIDLSEHHGDGTPGSVVWIAVTGLTDLHRELRGRDAVGNLRPGIDRTAPGGPTMTITDPFQNVLRFCETTS